MRYLKKALCLMVVVVMMMSIMAFPASASTTDDLNIRLLNDFPRFPVLRINSSGGYVRLLQRFLFVCPATHEAIYNTSTTTHGIDGGFGSVTDGAVRTFQISQFGVSGVDGIVGSDTWGAIYRWLNPYHDANLYFYDGEANWNRYVMCYTNTGSSYKLYTYDHKDTPFTTYFRSFTL